jgi:hypothetical protein
MYSQAPFSSGSYEGKVILENADFRIHVLTPDLQTQAKSVLVEGFADEPCSCKVQSDRLQRLTDTDVFVSYFAADCSNNGLSVICVEKTSGMVVCPSCK